MQTMPRAMQASSNRNLFTDTRARPERVQWSANHLRLLYLLSRFATYPRATDNEEKWLRNLPLLVMVYEAIVSGVLDYDYSPVCTNIVKNGQSRRIWMNISQDAKAAIDDLREHDLIKALKTCSEDFQPSTAFQVTAQGTKLLESFPGSEKKAIDAFLASSSGQHDLKSMNSSMVLFVSDQLQITFDVNDGKFRFVRNDGSVFISKVTEVEEVSYVSSPYLPMCLMRNEATFTSNASQAAKCRLGVNAIKDKLSFAVVLSNVRVMVGEWIPFGPNQIVTLNDRLGSLDRCQGGLFTSELDAAPTSTCLNIAPGLTKISIVDFEFDSFTNFEADIHAPHDEGIVQIENFGMHIHGDGTIIYGMFIDGIMDQPAETIYVDHLSRLLVDVDLDSSKIINDLLSPHQRRLMDMLFMQDARSRNKFSLITAESILPKLPAKQYLDRGEMENELKQILGEIHSVYDLSEDDKIIVGREGMLLMGPNANLHEPLILTHLALLSRELFVRFFFKRTFILDDLLNRARTYMNTFEQNPEALGAMRSKINQCAHDLILLEEILELLRESTRALRLPACPTDANGKLLYEQLELKKTHVDLEIRCKDLAKLLRGFRAKLKQVQSQNGNMAKMILETIVLSVERNISSLSETTRVNETTSMQSLDILLVLFTGILAFEMVDRIADAKLLGHMETLLPQMHWINQLVGRHFVDHAGLFFVVDVLWMLLIVWIVLFVTRFFIRHLTRTKRVSFTVHKTMDIAAFERFLLQGSKRIESRMSSFNEGKRTTIVVWHEITSVRQLLTWNKRLRWNLRPALRTQVTYDLETSILMDVTFSGKIREDAKADYKELMQQLHESECFGEPNTPAFVGKQRKKKNPTVRRDGLLRMLTRRNAPVHPTQEP